MPPNSSIYHNVPVMRQPQTWSCWYTSLQMVVAYQRGRGQGAGLTDPSENVWTKSLYDANLGVGSTPDERQKVADVLGFQTLYASVTAEGIWEIMRDVPIVYAGRWAGRSFGHWVVMVGISQTSLAINNPATGLETVDYNHFVGQVLQQTAERPLIHP
jgi:ABC-type bacteriocin/lantibiotic exporter with double-glycine peptidase domain